MASFKELTKDFKKIPLSRGKYALVDKEDYDYLIQWKWYCSAGGYAVRDQHITVSKNKYRKKCIYMHRVILGIPKGMDTDHIDMNLLDNRRCNLRKCTRSQNSFNKKKYKNNKQLYKGVYKVTKSPKWFSSICVEGDSHYLGIFETQEEAALAYNEASIRYHGEFSRGSRV